MSGAVVEAAAHTVVEGGAVGAPVAHTLVEEEKKPPEEEEKKPPEEEDKKVGDGGGTHINLEAGNRLTYASTLHGKDLHQLGCAEKAQVAVEAHKHQTEDTHLLAVTEENDASKRLLLKRKKGKKVKRSALVEVKKEQQLGDAEKTEDMILKTLFKEYSNEMGDSLATDPSEEEAQDDGDAEANNPVADWEAHLKVQKKQEANELDTYLTDGLFPRQTNFDILGWWKMHSAKYPILSCIARDVLAIQASTVASESSFSAGGRVITDHMSRLKSETVEGLLCLQDWLNAADPSNKDVEEEVHLVFYQESEDHEDTACRSCPNCVSSSLQTSNRMTDV